MKYKNFKIQNFKGIDSVDIDLSNNRILTLVGLNESGKTTILEAMNLFYKMIKGTTLKAKELNYYRPKGIDFTGNIIIEGSLIIEAHDKIKIQNFWKSLDKKKKLDIPDEFSYTYEFTYNLHVYKKTNRLCGFQVAANGSKKNLFDSDKTSWQKLVEFIKKELVPEILFYEDFIFDIPSKIHFNINPEAEEENVDKRNQEWQLVLNDIIKATNQQLNFQEHVVDIWTTDSDTAASRISKMEGVLNSKITNAWKALFQKDSKKLNFKEIKIKPEPIGEAHIDFSFEVKTDEDIIFPINDRSKGCKWFFSFLLFTEFRKNRTDNILFLLDEPASNLHTSAQIKILDAIKGLSDKSMVVYSTHSHHLINPEWLLGAYVVINDALSEKSLNGDMSFEENVKIAAKKYYNYVGTGEGSDKISYFQPILDALEYKPSAVEPIPNIVILEGRTDWYGYKYFNEIILKQKNGSVFNFYPGGGKDKLYEIIRIYLSWGRNFVVLLDGDDGVKSQQDYIKEFGEIVNDKIFTLKDVFGKKVDLEGLIDAQDKIIMHDTVFGNGSFAKLSSKKQKTNLNLSINKLFIDKTPCKVSKTTQDNFANVFKFIEAKL